MMTKNRKYIFEIVSKYFGNRYDAELEKDIQNWIVGDKFSEEKEAAMHDIWEKLAVEVDKSTYTSLRKVKGKLGIQPKPIRTTLFSFSRVAAILIPIFFVIGGYYLFFNKSVNMTELSASRGEVIERVLSDGTEVWINSGSSIKYDKNFKASERIVSLSGEASFNVKKHKSKPFVIKTAYLDVRVLGTQLSIRAYPEEGRSVVTLVSGTVSIETMSGENYQITPNQQFVYNNATSETSIKNIVVRDFVEQRNQSLLFDDATFEEIISDIERHYDVTIIVDDNLDILNDIYTVKFMNNESIRQVLTSLHESIGGFDYDISDDGTIYIYDTKSTPVPEEELPEGVTDTLAITDIVSGTDTVSGNYLVSIDSQEISYRELFEQIELQTGYIIDFNHSKFDIYNKLTGVVYGETDFNDILTDILDEIGFTYEIEGDHILIIEESGLQTVSGYVVDLDKDLPIADVLITWGSNKRSVKTDRDGYFAIENLKPGSYSIAINAPGYRTEYRELFITGVNEEAALTEAGSYTIYSIINGSLYPEYKKVYSANKETSLAEHSYTVYTVVEGSLYPEDRKYIAEVPGNEPLKIHLGDTSATTNPSTFDKADRPHFVIKSNLLYLSAIYTPNLAFEFSLSDKFTIEMLLGYNPFTLSENRRYKHLLIQSELRYWPAFAFNKHFAGLHLSYANYNIAGIGSTYMKSRTYDGTLFGVGISYGYNYRINRRWALEGTIGLGYANMRYDTYQQSGMGILKESYDYFGITKLGINIIYKIK